MTSESLIMMLREGMETEVQQDRGSTKVQKVHLLAKILIL